MTVTVPAAPDTVRFFTQEELEERERVVIAALERRFGSVESALAQEYTGSYPAEDWPLFSEYHDTQFLLER